MLYGWDISTAIIGFAALDDSGALLHTDYLDLRKVKGIYEKADRARKWVAGLRDKHQILPLPDGPDERHFVEERLAGFSGGGSNAGTLMVLGAFNLLVSWFIHESWRSDAVKVWPATVKATMASLGVAIPKGVKGDDAKDTRLKLSRKLVEPKLPLVPNKNGNTQPYCWDMCDAYCVAKTGYLKHK